MELVMKCLLVLFLTQSASCTSAPVLIIDPHAALRSGLVPTNPFSEMSSMAFAEIVHEAVHLSESILIFVEDILSVEDISVKDARGTPYVNLHTFFLEDKTKYLPSVIDPLKTLQQLLPPLESNIMHLRSPIKAFEKKFKYHYVLFQDNIKFKYRHIDQRVEQLRRHDEQMREAYDKLIVDHGGPVVMFYTGKRNLLSGADQLTNYARPLSEEASGDGVLLVTDNALIKLSGVILQQRGVSTLQVAAAVTTTSFARQRQATRLGYGDFELDFNFEYLRNDWILDSVVLLEGGEEVGRTNIGVGAPYGWSYACSEPIQIINTRDKSYVTISRYQLEPLRISRTSAFQDGQARGGGGMLREDKVTETTENVNTQSSGEETTANVAATGKDDFSNTVNCGTNFNCRILAGLFVTAIVVAITMFGIMTMFDCSGNDRMDDATQKPLVIIAEL